MRQHQKRKRRERATLASEREAQREPKTVRRYLREEMRREERRRDELGTSNDDDGCCVSY